MKPNEIDFVKNGKIVLPQDYYNGLYILDNNLLVIYQRSVSIIRNAFDGNPHEPDTEPFIEMQDYYSYEPPQVVRDKNGRIWCSIGGRMFFKDNIDDKWTETQGFHIGDSAPLVMDNGLIVFSTNYQHDTETEGIIIFNPDTASATFVAVENLGKSPVPKIQLPDGRLMIVNAATSEYKYMDISII
ncbi:MAG: hypothetical protein IKR94_07890 [Bacteroidales bacterium]|nr:hypothetical protein [Bacteroidales bacterium]